MPLSHTRSFFGRIQNVDLVVDKKVYFSGFLNRGLGRRLRGNLMYFLNHKIPFLIRYGYTAQSIRAVYHEAI